jgi:hypothetical protein
MFRRWTNLSQLSRFLSFSRRDRIAAMLAIMRDDRASPRKQCEFPAPGPPGIRQEMALSLNAN